jgi:CheY-like chemotaxis protein
MPAEKILIIDDERSIVKLLRHVLDGSDYKTEAAYTGADGLKKVGSLQPNLIILDVHMPEMDGWQVLEGVRSSEKTKDIPVIMLTEKNMMSDIEKADKLGVQGYVTKPFTVERVLSRVKAVLNK